MNKTSNSVQFFTRLVKAFFQKLGRFVRLPKKLDNLDQPLIVPTSLEPNTLKGEGDEAMLDLIISDVQRGVDIEKKYPDFYEKILKNPQLYQLFLDVLDILEKEKKDELVEPSIEFPIIQFMSSLKSAPSKPVEVHPSSGTVIIKWTYESNQLNNYFKSLRLMNSRAGFDYPKDKKVPILRSEINIEGRELYVTLDIIRPVKDRSQFQLHLGMILSDFEDEVACAELSCQATINWGAYKAVAHIDEKCQALFPPFPVNIIYDENEEAFIAALDLQLNLSLP